MSPPMQGENEKSKSRAQLPFQWETTHGIRRYDATVAGLRVPQIDSIGTHFSDDLAFVCPYERPVIKRPR